jgi:hypothetical protein
MQQFNLPSFEKSKTDWVELVVGRERDIDIAIPNNSRENIYRIIRGKRCLDEDSLHQEWAAALQFPYYYGHNWDALDECINDLHWLKGKQYLFCITNIDSVLKNDLSSLKTFFYLLKTTTMTWREPVPEDVDSRWTNKPIPFHILLHCEEAAFPKCSEIFSKLKLDIPSKIIPKFDDIS